MYSKGSNMSGARNNAPEYPWPIPRRKTVDELMEEFRKEWEERERLPVVLPNLPDLNDFQDEEVEF